jgi:hypothetical protein
MANLLLLREGGQSERAHGHSPSGIDAVSKFTFITT